MTVTVPAETGPGAPWADEHRRLNAVLNRAGARLVDDAAVFAGLVGHLGLPAPRRLAVLTAGGSGWDWTRGRAVPPEAWAEVLAGVTGGVAVRPADRRSPDRAIVADRDPATGGWRTAGRRAFSDASLAEALRTGPRAAWMVQERLHDHAELAPIGRPGRLTVLRVATLVGAGGVEVLWAALRRGAPNFLPPDWLLVDARTGTVDHVHADPLTWEGPPPEGRPVPCWREARALVERTALAVLPLRAVAVDLAVTDDGPVLLGAGADHVPAVAALAEAALPRLRAATAGWAPGATDDDAGASRRRRLARRAGVQRDAIARIRRGARVWGVPWPHAYRRAMRLRRTRGFRLEESAGGGLLDRACTWDAQSVSRAEVARVQGAVNAVAPEAAGDRVLFGTLATAAGLPVPRRLAVLGRGGAGWDWTRGAPVLPGGWAALLESLPDEIVVRPAHEDGDRGVRVLTRDRAGWRLPGGGWTDGATLAAGLLADPGCGVWSVEARPHDHPDLAVLGTGEAPRTLRMVTLVDGGGEASLLWAVLGIPQDGPAGASAAARPGTVRAWVDVASGAVTRAAASRPGDLGVVPVASDPASGLALVGRKIPHWAGACDLVLRGARCMLPLRALGWDVAVTADGPVLNGADPAYDPVPPFPMRAAIERVRAAARPPDQHRRGGAGGADEGPTPHR